MFYKSILSLIKYLIIRSRWDQIPNFFLYFYVWIMELIMDYYSIFFTTHFSQI